VVAALSTLVGAYLSGTPAAAWSPRTLTASLVIWLVCASGFAINDYCDSGADAEGKAGRPIPAGLVSRSWALAVAVVLATSGVVLAATTGPDLALAALFLVAVSGAYSLLRLKAVPLAGIGTVAFLSAATGIYGALAAGGLSRAVLAFAVCVFVNSFAMETLYTIDDIVADARAGTRTTAVRLGPTLTLQSFQACNVLLLAVLYWLPWQLGLASTAYLATVSLLTVLPTVAASVLAGMEYDATRVTRARLAMRFIRLAALGPMLLLHG
jgi:4-hydroxybenzoate polyprenyltransferase